MLNDIHKPQLHTLYNPSSSWRCSVPATRPFKDSTTTSWAAFISCLDRMLAFQEESATWIWLDQSSIAPKATTTKYHIHIQDSAVTEINKDDNRLLPHATRCVKLNSDLAATSARQPCNVPCNGWSHNQQTQILIIDIIVTNMTKSNVSVCKPFTKYNYIYNSLC